MPPSKPLLASDLIKLSRELCSQVFGHDFSVMDNSMPEFNYYDVEVDIMYQEKMIGFSFTLADDLITVQVLDDLTNKFGPKLTSDLKDPSCVQTMIQYLERSRSTLSQ